MLKRKAGSQFVIGLAVVSGIAIPPASWAQAAKAKKAPTDPRTFGLGLTYHFTAS